MKKEGEGNLLSSTNTNYEGGKAEIVFYFLCDLNL